MITSPRWSRLLSVLSRFWEGEKHCTTIAHLFTSAGCEAGSSHHARTLSILRNACTWRQRSSSGVAQGPEVLSWITPENGMGGPSCQPEEAAVHWDLGWVKKTSRFMSQPQGFMFVARLAEAQGLCSTPQEKENHRKKRR